MTKQTIHIPSGYKPSPLGIIPEDWEVKRLGEIFTFKNGVNAGKDSYGEGVRFVNTMDVLNNEYITGKILRGRVAINEKTKNEFLVSFGDVLFNRTSETREEVGCSTVYLDNEDAVFGGFVIRAHDIDANILNPRFKQYCFQPSYIRNQISALGNGAIRYNLGQEDLSKVNLLIPTKVEQEAIASVINLWDTAIAKQTALIEKLTLRKRGLMQQLLTGKKRLKGFGGEWKEVRLGEVFDERNETNCDNLPLLSITGDKGVIYQSESDKRDISNEDKSKYKRICQNDIGYNTMRMWQGRSALSELEGIVSPAYTIVTPKKSIDVRFIAMLIQQPRIVYSFWTHSQGLVSDTLNCKYPDFCQVKVSIPSKEEQTAVADFFVEIDKEIEIHKQKLAAMQEQKKGLMQVLLTGKKRIVNH
ncbi:MAG: restriction endonuclease subunit S [Bacteroidales bacterium]|nr:restriction endonuclease subunit S [Bacteroidales bacterium]